jgi:hypothetical protein
MVPTIGDIVAQTINEDANSGALVATISDTETAAANLTLAGSSSDTTLVPNSNIVFGGSAGNRTITVTPVANLNGSATITITVTDAVGNSARDTFALTVTPVNDVPSFVKGADSQVVEDAPAQTISGWATGISKGPGNESSQSLTFVVSNNNTALFSTQPSVSSDGTLTYTPRANANGTATVTVSLKDDGGTSNGGVDTSASQTFRIDVSPVNDEPVLGAISDQAASEDSELSFTASARDIDGDTLTFSLASGAPSGATIDSAGGVFRWTPGESDGGTRTSISVRVTDNGTPNLSVIHTFAVDVAEVNSAPVIAAIDDRAVEAGQTVQLTVAASDSDVPSNQLTFSLDSGSPAGADINPTTGGFTWTPTGSQSSGASVVTVRVTDNGQPSLSATASFNVQVNAMPNTAPIMSGLFDTTVEQGSLLSVTNAAVDLDLPAQTITWNLASGAPEGMTIDAATGLLRWPVSASQTLGKYAVTVKTTDNGNPPLSTQKSFEVDVVPGTNLRLGAIANQQVSEDSGARIVSINDIRAGANSQTLTVTARSSDSALIPDPVVSYTSPQSRSSLSYEPVANRNGKATLTVTVTDDLGAEAIQTFEVTVLPVNDAPTLLPLADVLMELGETNPVVRVTGISAGATNEMQDISITVVSDNASLIPNPLVQYTSPASEAQFVLAPVTGQLGEATISVILRDNGGVENGGKDTTVIRFKATVVPGKLQTVCFQHGDGDLGVWRMKAEKFRTAVYMEPIRPSDADWAVKAIADFDRDGQKDLLFQKPDGSLAVWLMEGTVLKSGALLNPPTTGDGNWQAVAAADMDGDGQTDVIFQHATNRTLAVWRMNGLTLVQPSLLNPSTTGDNGWSIVGTGDFNRDSKADLVFQHTDGTIALWMMDGLTLTESVLLDPAQPLQTSWRVKGVIDLNDDGQLDLLVQHTDETLGVLYLGGTTVLDSALFNPPQTFPGWRIIGP